MTTFTMFSICLLVWLLIGFYVGLKVVYVEDNLSKAKQDEFKKKFKEQTGISIIDDPQWAKAWNMVIHKPSALAMITLLGGISGYLHTVSKIKKFKAFIAKKRGK